MGVLQPYPRMRSYKVTARLTLPYNGLCSTSITPRVIIPGFVRLAYTYYFCFDILAFLLFLSECLLELVLPLFCSLNCST